MARAGGRETEAFARVSRSFAALIEEPEEVPPEAPVAPSTTPADRKGTAFKRELARHFPVSAITLHNEALQRRADELGPIEGSNRAAS
jgi:hypothetical protein